jgi:hypothetical protein
LRHRPRTLQRRGIWLSTTTGGGGVEAGAQSFQETKPHSRGSGFWSPAVWWLKPAIHLGAGFRAEPGSHAIHSRTPEDALLTLGNTAVPQGSTGVNYLEADAFDFGFEDDDEALVVLRESVR